MALGMGIGTSQNVNVYLAGQEAAQHMAAQLGALPQLTLVFASLRFADHRMLNGISSVTEGAPLIGCTDAGGIQTSGPVRRSLTVIGLKIEDGAVAVGAGLAISKDALAAGQDLGRALSAVSKPKLALVFPDGLTGNSSEIISGVQERIGAGVPIAGGAAGDDFLFQRSFQFLNNQILTDAAPGAAIAGHFSVGIGVRHGWMPLGKSHRVTKAIGRHLQELDGRPAISIYEEYLGLQRQDLPEDEPFSHVAITYPLGLSLPGVPEYLLRQAFQVDARGGLVCTAEIPEGSEVRLMIGAQESALQAADRAARDAVEQLEYGRLTSALVFCNVARQKMLGSEFQGEIDVIRNALGGAGVRLAGFYGYGEEAPVHRREAGKVFSSNMYHNESVVVVGLGS